MDGSITVYSLPLEIIGLVLDYLSIQDILNICEDPAFPVAATRQKHIADDRQGGTILHALSEQGWNHSHLATRGFIDILGESWESVNWMNKTPLSIAAGKGHLDLCRLFIEAGAWINPSSEKQKGIPPLFSAVSSPGNDDVISLLIEHGADIFWKGPSDIGIIQLAAGNANLHTMKLLLRSGADPNDWCAIGTPLHSVEDPTVAKLLIERGADVNAVIDLDGRRLLRGPPLMTALERGNTEVVKILLDAGADTEVFGKEGLTALCYAIANSGGETYTVKMLIDAGCDVNYSVPGGYQPPILLAANHVFEDIVRILIEAGAAVIGPTEGIERNFVFTVAANSSPSILQMFIDGGADVNVEQHDLQTPLFAAIKALRPENVKTLLNANANPSHKDEEGTEPAILVVAGSYDTLRSIDRYFSDSYMEWISESDYCIHHEDENLDEDTSMLKQLIDHGANISETEFKGIGILHFAAWRNDEHIVQLLLDAGADPLFTDPDGNTAADWAAEMTRTQEGNAGIADMLRAAMEAAVEAK